MVPQHRRRVYRIVTLAVVMVALAACKKGGGDPRMMGFPPTEVSIVTVHPEAVPQTFEFPGQVQAYRRVEVRSRVDGVIEERPFAEGAIVQPGQVLYRLDSVRYEAAYRAAAARLEKTD